MGLEAFEGESQFLLKLRCSDAVIGFSSADAGLVFSLKVEENKLQSSNSYQIQCEPLDMVGLHDCFRV